MRNYGEIDRKIIGVLKYDSKLSTSAIAKKIGISQKVVLKRIRELIRTRIIKNFTINIDYDKLGKTAYWLLGKYSDKQSRDKMLDIISKLDPTEFIETEIEEYNFLVKLYSNDVDLDSVIWKLKDAGVSPIKRLVMRELVDTTNPKP